MVLVSQLPAGQQVLSLDTSSSIYSVPVPSFVSTASVSSLPTLQSSIPWVGHDTQEIEQPYVKIADCIDIDCEIKTQAQNDLISEKEHISYRPCTWRVPYKLWRLMSNWLLWPRPQCDDLRVPDVNIDATYRMPESPGTDNLSEHVVLSRDIPEYVLEYAPLVHLFSGEQYWPCDIAGHLEHMTPRLNFTAMQSSSDHPKLEGLDDFNKYERGRWVYLTSNDDVEEYPDWLGGQKNIPNAPGNEDGNPNPGLVGGRSDAPAILVVVEKGHGIVDAFWFFFYSYNLGNSVFNVRFGNHVGDWEHSAIRFRHGRPEAVFFSEHNFGSAYSYDAVEKIGKRPVIYSAVGTHAMYATSGRHPYVLPWGILHDETDKGPLWDPTLNAHTYTYNHKTDVIHTSNLTPDAPTGWFHYAGHWGDKIYPLNDKRQYSAFGQYHYVSGPLGPRFKNLGRKKICGGPDSKPCVIKHWLGGEQRAPRFEGYGEEADAYDAWTEAQRASEQ